LIQRQDRLSHLRQTLSGFVASLEPNAQGFQASVINISDIQSLIENYQNGLGEASYFASISK